MFTLPSLLMIRMQIAVWRREYNACDLPFYKSVILSSVKSVEVLSLLSYSPSSVFR